MAAMPVHFSLCILEDTFADHFRFKGLEFRILQLTFLLPLQQNIQTFLVCTGVRMDKFQLAQRGEEPRRKILCYGVARHEMIGGARGGWAKACNAVNPKQKTPPKILVKKIGAPILVQTGMFETAIRLEKEIGRDTAWFVV